MREALYPKEKYPQGLSDLAESLNNLGSLFYYQGRTARRGEYYQRA